MSWSLLFRWCLTWPSGLLHKGGKVPPPCRWEATPMNIWVIESHASTMNCLYLQTNWNKTSKPAIFYGLHCLKWQIWSVPRWSDVGPSAQRCANVSPKKFVRWTQLAFCYALMWSGTTKFYPYPSGLLHWYLGNLAIAPEPVNQAWRMWANGSHELSKNWYHRHNKIKQNKTACKFYGIYGTDHEGVAVSW